MGDEEVSRKTQPVDDLQLLGYPLAGFGMPGPVAAGAAFQGQLFQQQLIAVGAAAGQKDLPVFARGGVGVELALRRQFFGVVCYLRQQGVGLPQLIDCRKAFLASQAMARLQLAQAALLPTG